MSSNDSIVLNENAKVDQDDKFNTRYFQVDEGYDKRVYENDCKNIFKILGCFFCYYSLQVLYFWGHLSLALTHPTASMWFNIIIWLCALGFIIGMIFVGYKSNQKQSRHNFYEEKISERE